VAAGMELQCFQTWTGIKFVLTAEPGTHPDMSAVLQEIYILYADCVAKDPFYELEMPIRSELFTQAVDALIDRVEKANTGTSGGIMGNNTSNSRNR
jgi:trafficking protein particle complex subunit 4